PPTPTDSSSPRFTTTPQERGHSHSQSDSSPVNPNVVTSPSGNMISHRRVRSGSATLGPSKLSNITSAPLTPTPENGSTTPSGQGGFFSSVFSAAQNAANQLSNSIANTNAAPTGNRSRSGTQELKDIAESPEVETLADKTDSHSEVEEKELAVKTLGMGDLSLSHLGISEAASGTNTPVASKFPEELKGGSDLPNDDSLTNRSYTTAPASGEGYEITPSTTIVEDIQPFLGPRSVYESSLPGEQTPPNGSVFEGNAGIKRSGSIRSAIGHRRKRGSTATSGGVIGAAIVAAHGSMADPKAGNPKITGFAVASKKRNRDFHQLFRSVPDDDYLIEDYSCALQREILAHGRLYVSEGHLCFSSNIFGWVTTLVMSFDEIVSVEKRSTALLFKNGLMISTLHAKNVFASFTSRDSTYDLIVGIWKLGHPSLRSSLNGVTLDETGGGDKTEKADGSVAPPDSQSGSESDSEAEEGDEMYDEDDEDEDGMSFTQAEGSVAGSDMVEKVVSRKASAAVVTNGVPTESKEEKPTLPSIDFPGPAAHSPTTCSDGETHYAKVLADEIIPAPLGKIYSLMFGPASVIWMRHWLTVEQKCMELTMEGTSAAPLTSENKVRNYSYIKPLGGAIGPKQTKCICTETLDSLDLEKAISVTISTQTPDVPSGNVFSVKTRYCLSWGEGNSTRLQVNNAIEWTGKSWLKGPIEKGANDGQVQYTKDIIAALKTAVSSRRGTVALTGKGKKKGRKGRESKSLAKTLDGVSDKKPVKDDWGFFEPLHGILGPIIDIIGPLLTGNILYGIFVGLLVASWFRFGFLGRNSGDASMSFLGTPQRVAAYEEMWRREESELWAWLEDRVGMERVREVGKMPVEAKTVEDRLKDEKMEEREMDAAIRITEDRLRVLKNTVEKKKGAALGEGTKAPVVDGINDEV
ncbi:putative membrane protein, partial [Lachnellula willkommii]